MYQGGSDEFLGARDDIRLADEAWGCDLEAEIVVVTGDVPRGVSPEEALSHIRLVGLVNDVSLRNLIPAELEKGFGFVQSKPASALSPVLVTPESLGNYWQNGKLHRTLMVDLNDAPFGRAVASDDCTFDFGVLIAHLAKTRNIGAGSVIGSGTVSNRDAGGGPGKPVADGGLGYSCLAELRMVEKIQSGEMVTPFLKAGDTIRIEVRDDAGHSIFGAIEQAVRNA
jgi:fumarylacetoacetate (FAA) hydrolase